MAALQAQSGGEASTRPEAARKRQRTGALQDAAAMYRPNRRAERSGVEKLAIPRIIIFCEKPIGPTDSENPQIA